MKWEYKLLTYQAPGSFATKIRNDGLEVQLEQLGDDGWELAATVPATSSGAGNTLVFKRQKELNGI